MNKVVAVALDKKFKRLEFKIQALAMALLKVGKKGNAYFEVYLVDKKFMNKNVLAFPAPHFFSRPDIKQKNLGEIYLNPDYIKKNSESLAYMLVHGFLHLLGYDHKKKSDRLIMEHKEARLLSRFSTFHF